MAPLIARYHASENAFEPSRETVMAPVAYIVQSEKDNDGLFRVKGVANGRTLSFIVDTGATTTVLSARDAAALGLAPDQKDRTSLLRTASGPAAMVWKQIKRLDVAGNQITDLDIVVVPNGPDHSLLGQDILSRLGTVTLKGNRLEIRPARS